MTNNYIFGLNNNGNTCYQNAAIQSLLCITKFTNLLTNKELLIDVLKHYQNKTEFLNNNMLLAVLINKLILKEDLNVKNPMIINKCIVNYKIKYKNDINMPFKNEFRRYEQLDSYDYLRAILTILHNELNCDFMINEDEKTLNTIKKDIEDYDDINNKVIEYNQMNVLKYSLKHLEKIINDNGYSLINSLFSFQLINVSECETCGYKNFGFTYGETLDLDVFNNETHQVFSSLEECLDNQININTYSNENEHKINSNHLRCYNYYKFFKLPNILIIRLKRFNDKNKINDPINIPENLNLNKYIHMYSNDKNTKADYSLISAVVHLGNINGGHYIAVGKKTNYDWCEFNDSVVSQIRDDINKYLNKSYILFYQKN